MWRFEKVPSGLYDMNIPLAMVRWTNKHHPYLTFCCIHTLELTKPENRHKIQDCVEIDMMVSPPDSKGRYQFTPLVTKRTTWDDFYLRRNDYDSTDGDLAYEKCKEKNQTTTYNGETGVVCIVLISLRNEIAFSAPMFFQHTRIDSLKEQLDDWDMKRHQFVEKTAF
ncbi:hypothetical protein BT96DRAFT_42072 [Gymnopus androsaceus JB14]|uniref:Uncharacterized protein n=1 Tax=Gymnopus androsaceus JB14 TaxID=1447944 RepID=A0A6A4HKN9_9AGAR|nr:hypothetical protein BT96DRAFT_42072 [Gymnopus androsaceus JB14]